MSTSPVHLPRTIQKPVIQAPPKTYNRRRMVMGIAGTLLPVARKYSVHADVTVSRATTNARPAAERLAAMLARCAKKERAQNVRNALNVLAIARAGRAQPANTRTIQYLVDRLERRC